MCEECAQQAPTQVAFKQKPAPEVLERLFKLFITAYHFAKDECPFTNFPKLCKLKIAVHFYEWYR